MILQLRVVWLPIEDTFKSRNIHVSQQKLKNFDFYLTPSITSDARTGVVIATPYIITVAQAGMVSKIVSQVASRTLDLASISSFLSLS